MTRQSLPSNSTISTHTQKELPPPLIITVIITNRQAQLLIIWSHIFEAHTFPTPCTNPSPRLAP